MLRCRALVRREDGLIFKNTLECHTYSDYMAEQYIARATRSEFFLRGQDIYDNLYDVDGRHLYNRKYWEKKG